MREAYYEAGEWRIDLDEFTTLVSDNKTSLENALDQVELLEATKGGQE